MTVLLIGVLMFGIMGGIAYGAYILINPSRTAQDRLRDLTGNTDADGAGLTQRMNDPAMERITERLSALANPTSVEEKNSLRMKLLQAGYTARHAVEVYSALRVVLAILLPILCAPLIGTKSLTYTAGWVVILAAGGYYAPTLAVSNAIQKRQKKLLAPFPDALDLLVSSVEAGLGLDAAFRRVADEMEGAAPELSREFQLVNHEISAGQARIEALKHLADRTGLEEIGSLVNMLTQAERFGTSIARSLRIHSQITRQKRMAKAEEEAAKVSPKLTVVMILFLLPCLMVVLLGPAVVNIKNALFK